MMTWIHHQIWCYHIIISVKGFRIIISKGSELNDMPAGILLLINENEIKWKKKLNDTNFALQWSYLLTEPRRMPRIRWGPTPWTGHSRERVNLYSATKTGILWEAHLTGSRAILQTARWEFLMARILLHILWSLRLWFTRVLPPRTLPEVWNRRQRSGLKPALC